MSAVRTAANATFAAADLGRRRRPGPRILIYHQIGTDLGREMEVSVDRFVEHLDLLASAGRVVSLEEAVEAIGSPDDDRVFVLTFDDGYADVFEHAFPVLRERRLPFTLYLTTSPIEAEAPSFGHPGARPLRWEQIEEMLASGLMTVGAHTHTHPDLRALERPSVEGELDTSNELIEKRLGVRPRHFAYPKGWWSPTADAAVAARYATAVLGAGPPVTPETSLHRLHRVAVQRSDGTWFLRRKLATGMPLEESVRRRLQGYAGPDGP